MSSALLASSKPVYVAWLCPLIALSAVATAYVFANSALWLFLSLGAALLISLFGIFVSLMLLIRNKQRWLNTLCCLAANACFCAFSAIYIFGATVIGIGFSV